MARASFGLILANRAVVLGAIQARDLIELSQQAETSGAFDTLWVGDSLLAKPRLEAVALLAALAGATSRLKLAVGCLATFVHRHPLLFAQQWASLDVISGGRALLAVCLGGPDEQSAAQALEHKVMGVRSSERVGRLEEGIQILRKVWSGEKVSHQGEFYQFEGVKIEPRPAQQPCPIWIASNPTGLTWKGGASASDAAVERGLRRVARYADGWMTNKVSPAQFREQWARIAKMAREEGRNPDALGSALYHNININEDRAAGARGEQGVPRHLLHVQVLARLRRGLDGGGEPGPVHRRAARLRGGGPRPHRAPAHVLGPARPAQAVPGRGGARPRGRPLTRSRGRLACPGA